MSKEQVIKVLVVDDHAIIRRGIRAVLDLEPDIELVGEAENGAQAVELEKQLQPDVILMDLMMPEMDGITAIKEIKKQNASACILVLTNFAGEEMIFPAIKSGAVGYHLKDSSPEALIEAIRQVSQGMVSLHPSIAKKLLEEIHNTRQQTMSDESLTPRELDILRLIAQGRENREISDQLVISEATVRTHVSNILGKLHLASRTQAALYALKEGLVSLNDPGEVH
jgi:two-component system, NarL family, response regulator LiaR